MSFVCVFVAVFFMVCSVKCENVEFHVAVNGNGTTCSLNEPCLFRTAFNKLRGGQSYVLYLKSGVYDFTNVTEFVFRYTQEINLTISSYSPFVSSQSHEKRQKSVEFSGALRYSLFLVITVRNFIIRDIYFNSLICTNPYSALITLGDSAYRNDLDLPSPAFIVQFLGITVNYLQGNFLANDPDFNIESIHISDSTFTRASITCLIHLMVKNSHQPESPFFVELDISRSTFENNQGRVVWLMLEDYIDFSFQVQECKFIRNGLSKDVDEKNANTYLIYISKNPLAERDSIHMFFENTSFTGNRPILFYIGSGYSSADERDNNENDVPPINSNLVYIRFNNLEITDGNSFIDIFSENIILYFYLHNSILSHLSGNVISLLQNYQNFGKFFHITNTTVKNVQGVAIEISPQYSLNMKVTNCLFQNNQRAIDWSVSESKLDSTLIISHSHFVDHIYGGAIFASGGSVLVKNSTFVNNRKAGGDGGAIQFINTVGIGVVKSRFLGCNVQDGNGGSISFMQTFERSDAVQVTFIENEFRDSNSSGAVSYGGCVVVTSKQIILDISDNSFVNCNAKSDGGGIYLDFINLPLDGSEIDVLGNIFKNQKPNFVSSVPVKLGVDTSPTSRTKNNCVSQNDGQILCAFDQLRFYDYFNSTITHKVKSEFGLGISILNYGDEVYSSDITTRDVNQSIRFEYNSRFRNACAVITLRNNDKDLSSVVLELTLGTNMTVVYIFVSILCPLFCVIMTILVSVIFCSFCSKQKRKVRKEKYERFNDYGSINTEGAASAEIEQWVDEYHIFVGNPNAHGSIFFTSKKSIFKSRELVFSGNFFNGQKQGFGKEFYSNNNVKYEGYYQYNTKNGKGVEYYESGKRKFAGNFKNGVRDGKGIEFDNGREKFRATWKDGNLEEVDFEHVNVEEIDLERIFKKRIRCLATGNTSTVWTVMVDGKKFAAKIIRDELLSDFDQRESIIDKIEKRVKIMSCLEHPHIMKCYGWNISHGDVIGYLCEMCECSVSSRLTRRQMKENGGGVKKNKKNPKKKRKFDTPEKLKILLQTSEGMKFLHQNSLIHRNLQWSNVLLDPWKNVKIHDFGGKSKHESDFEDVLDETDGSPEARNRLYYYAPEVLLRGELSNSCDIYSYGIMIMEIIFESTDPFQLEENDGIGNCDSCNNSFSIRDLGTHVCPPCNLRPFQRNEKYPEELKWLVELSRECMDEDPTKRPNFEQISYRIRKNIEETIIL